MASDSCVEPNPDEWIGFSGPRKAAPAGPIPGPDHAAASMVLSAGRSRGRGWKGGMARRMPATRSSPSRGIPSFSSPTATSVACARRASPSTGSITPSARAMAAHGLRRRRAVEAHHVGQESGVGSGVRQTKGPAEDVTELVVQPTSRVAEHATGQVSALERVLTRAFVVETCRQTHGARCQETQRFFGRKRSGAVGGSRPQPLDRVCHGVPQAR